MNATTTASMTWIIRPKTTLGVRNFGIIAKDVETGEEIVSGPNVGLLSTVEAARAWIVKHFDGGRSFPKVPSYSIDVAGIDAIRSKYRFA